MSSEIHSTLDYIRSIHDLLVSIDTKLGNTGERVSSVEIKTSTRGVDITTKVYAGSPVSSAGDAAMDEFIRVGTELNKRLGVE